ncbi:thiosulfate/3-mercaptopyruvate sulfurtransferase [Inhella inkyongensis]|uniref:Thiosulfate/3-mercaptopyruvate sulfurtransferase n=1 Tax=Inhella inkyongensis TaxID=392593 RepID=A0A840S654_9BURK|nr:sulfurtransferase [Inhella inkyongensis]MBB5204274.1 thiosulfate/3-mercaptopyruvate sulfurtransferase [Inhella inkyongensis]
MNEHLIDATSLQRELAGPQPPLLFDLRFELSDPQAGARAYAQGHLPGAHYLHLDADLSAPLHGETGRFRGRHPLPEREVFAQRLAQRGWAPGRAVVAYDAQGGMYAARLWWMLRWLGEHDVRLLDGGLSAWSAAGLTLSTAIPPLEPAPTPQALGAELPTLSAAQVAAQLGRILIVDARGPERFRGEVEPLDTQAGHIPGALNRPFALNLQADGRFKPAEQLRQEWQTLLGKQRGDAVVHQCGSGVTACHNLFAVELAGLGLGSLYPGSWSEWSADPRRPVAKG